MNKLLVEELLGYHLTTRNADDLVDAITQSLCSNRCRWLACLNVHSFAVATKSDKFSRALKAADWLVPDGVGMVLSSRMLGGKVSQRITGSDIFYGLNDWLEETGGSVFFLGSSPACLEDISKRLKADYPNIQLRGTYSPPFKEEFSEKDNEDMIEAINSCAPDVLWVGMTSPKQDLWLHENSHKLKAKFAAGIGAVFDFYTGRTRRAPLLMRNLGLEWLWRFLQQPRRLGGRIFISGTIFIWHLTKLRFNK